MLMPWVQGLLGRGVALLVVVRKTPSSIAQEHRWSACGALFMTRSETPRPVG